VPCLFFESPSPQGTHKEGPTRETARGEAQKGKKKGKRFLSFHKDTQALFLYWSQGPSVCGFRAQGVFSSSVSNMHILPFLLNVRHGGLTCGRETLISLVLKFVVFSVGVDRCVDW
jgi:hypothetical protein